MPAISGFGLVALLIVVASVLPLRVAVLTVAVASVLTLSVAVLMVAVAGDPDRVTDTLRILFKEIRSDLTSSS